MKESQLDNKTSIATNDYVRMVDENGNSVKIKKDSFMAAIRNALPSIISDGNTGGGSVLSIINGALKTRTDANLASVLGVFKKYNGTSQVNPNGWYRVLEMNLSADHSQSFLLYVSNGNTNAGNVNLLFFVGFGYGGIGEISTYKCKPFIQQIGKGNPCGSGVQAFTKELRIVKDGSKYFLDIRYGSIGGTGNRVQYVIRPLCVDNVPTFSVGTTIGDSLTVMAQKTVEYLTE